MMKTMKDTKKLTKASKEEAALADLEGFRVKPRDYKVWSFLLDVGGMAADYQLNRLFWGGKPTNTAVNRLNEMVNAELIQRVPLGRKHYLKTDFQVEGVPSPQRVYWLLAKGAYQVSAQRGLSMDALQPNPAQAPDLIADNLPWLEWSRWNSTYHDVAVTNVLIDLMDACRDHPNRKILNFWPETVFRRQPDEISVNGIPRRPQPDLVTRIRTRDAVDKSKGHDWMFLWEIDTSSEGHPKVLDKITAGAEYINSYEYRHRFGGRYGRFLLLTSTVKRMHNIRKKARKIIGHNVWGFSAFELWNPETALDRPIWFNSDGDAHLLTAV